MDKPLTKWYCDVCGEPIEAAQDGYVVWHPKEGHGFRVIHQGRCDHNDCNSSKALDEFLGTEGLTYLLSHLSLGPLMRNAGGSPRTDVPNLDEFVDFMRRVQVPFYEEARRLFGTQRVIDDFYDANEYMPYCSDKLKRMIEDKESED